MKRRVAEVIALGARLASEFRRSRIGALDRVLAERPARDRPGFLEGFDSTYQRVLVPGSPSEAGSLIPVRIVAMEGEACLAEREEDA
jgi:tRNA A37 methylthiotransferase MiaB